MPQSIEFEGQIHVFPDDFSEADIAAALSGTDDSGGSARGMLGPAVGGGMAAAPFIVSGINRAAGLAGRLAATTAGRYAPGAAALGAGYQLSQGNTRGAVGTAATAAAMSQVPRVLRAVQAATAPARSVPGATSSVLTAGGNPYQLPPSTVRAGMFTRLANAMARYAGPAGLAIQTIFGEGAAGHRPAGETPEVTAARQAEFQRQYDAMRKR